LDTPSYVKQELCLYKIIVYALRLNVTEMVLCEISKTAPKATYRLKEGDVLMYSFKRVHKF